MHLKQKIARNLNFTGVKSQLPQNLTKTSENDVHDRTNPTKNFVRRWKMKCWGSSETRFGQVSSQTELSSGGKRSIKISHFFHVLTSKEQKMQNVSNQKNIGFQGRKMKCWGSSETRFGQVPGQSEPSSGGKRTFKVCKHFETNFHRKMKCRGSSETRFGKV